MLGARKFTLGYLLLSQCCDGDETLQQPAAHPVDWHESCGTPSIAAAMAGCPYQLYHSELVVWWVAAKLSIVNSKLAAVVTCVV
jgi:hypothetical protein